MLPDVKQKTIKPIIDAVVAKGTMIYTDEYDIYARLPVWGYQHKTVCHSRGEYARDEDGDGFHEVHVNTLEGFWSLLRSWLRPHRGISQKSSHLPRVDRLDNVANITFEWVVTVERQQLRPHYREGFGDVPLNLRWQPEAGASAEGGADGPAHGTQSTIHPGLVRDNPAQRPMSDRDLRAIGADHAPVSSATPGAASGPEPDRRRTDKAES